MGEIAFCLNSEKDSWFIKINDDGIFFNHDKYPDSTANDFAQAFMYILEKSYDVKFIKRDINGFDKRDGEK